MHATSSSCRTLPSSSGRGLRALPSTLTSSSILLAHPTFLESHQDFFKPLPKLVIATGFFQLTIVAPFAAFMWFR
jgi:hypothetical protein